MRPIPENPVFEMPTARAAAIARVHSTAESSKSIGGVLVQIPFPDKPDQSPPLGSGLLAPGS